MTMEEDIFKPYRKFLDRIHILLLREIRAGCCAGKVIKWRRK